MGVVYKARHLGLNRVVAVKVMIGGSFASAVDKSRFRFEAESVARLHHPNVVQVYDVGEHAGLSFITFEFVDGPTLRQWQNGRAVLPRYAAQLAIHIARAVQHAHDNRIVHRDLKPANILLAGVGGQEPGVGKDNSGSSPNPDSRLPTPKVTDFGLAKPLEGAANITASGAACGTPNYMAPEQIRGGPGAALPSADIWGVGAVLFELLTGRPPFTGTDAAAIMTDILMLEPPTVAQFAVVPRDLEVIVAKCLEKEPSRRYLTAGDLAADLERFLAGQSILARPISSARRAARWVRRNPLVAGFGAALFLGLLGVSVVAVALFRAVDREQEAHAEEARLRSLPTRRAAARGKPATRSVPSAPARRKRLPAPSLRRFAPRRTLPWRGERSSTSSPSSARFRRKTRPITSRCSANCSPVPSHSSRNSFSRRTATPTSGSSRRPSRATWAASRATLGACSNRATTSSAPRRSSGG